MHRHRAASFLARSSPFSGSGEAEERQRLGAMLASYGLCERLVKGDGNCQARRSARKALAVVFLARWYV